MVDKHIVKMPLEHSQMLSTAYRVSISLGYRPHSIKGEAYTKEEIEIDGIRIYKGTHVNHPCSVWARTSLSNFKFLCELNREIDKERMFRFGSNKIGKSILVSEILEDEIDLPDIGLTPFALAMPSDVVHSNAIRAYRQYYSKYKRHLFSWKKRKTPHWIADP